MSILLESDSTTPGVLLGWQRQIHLPLSPGARERNKLRQTAIPAPPLIPLDVYGPPPAQSQIRSRIPPQSAGWQKAIAEAQERRGMVMTVPNAQSFVCLFEYKREQVYAIGAVDLPTTLQNVRRLFPDLQTIANHDMEMYGLVPRIGTTSISANVDLPEQSSLYLVTHSSGTPDQDSRRTPSTSKRHQAFKITPSLYDAVRNQIARHTPSATSKRGSLKAPGIPHFKIVTRGHLGESTNKVCSCTPPVQDATPATSANPSRSHFSTSQQSIDALRELGPQWKSPEREIKSPPATPIKSLTGDQISPPPPFVPFSIARRPTIDPFPSLRSLVRPSPASKPLQPKAARKKTYPRPAMLPVFDRTNHLPGKTMSKNERKLHMSLQAVFDGRGLA